jgi:plasmid stabilization system protein ParE
MALRVKISARAALHTRRAAQWWLKNRPAGPSAVAKDIGEAIALLSEQPGIGAKYEGARTPGVRRLYLGRIGYFPYYRVNEEALDVLALWHSSRGEQPHV